MFAIPGQSYSLWRETLEEALGLSPPHISFYGLQLEEGTPMHRMAWDGEISAADDETDRRMYDDALKLLAEKAYVHYEISNAAKPGRECRHNMKYWSMTDYLGLGLGAHSYLSGKRYRKIPAGGGVRTANTVSLEDYLSAKGRDGRVASRHENTENDELSEYMFTGLRKIRGVSLADFEARFGAPARDFYGAEIEKLAGEGLLEQADGALRLTRRGIDVSDRVFTEFILL
jgi:oxygen-independent coproporphyrinogen-3 oxidase